MTRWTADQEKAISTPTGDGNIIVSAAAGSGKTAVLVERVIRKLMAGGSIDRLLIVTFTNAAAAEMRERIIKRLTAVLDQTDRPESARHLKRQTQLAETADIMTIDAFCIRVVQNNFHALGADPDVGIADEGLAGLMRREAIERVFSALYKTDDDKSRHRFLRLINAYSSNRDDHGLEEIIEDIYKFINPFAEPLKWLDDAVEAYKLPVFETPYAKRLTEITQSAAASCADAIAELVPDISDSALYSYAQVLSTDAKRICSADGWKDIVDICKKAFDHKKSRSSGVLSYTVPPPPESVADGVMSNKLLYISRVFNERLNSGVAMEADRLCEYFENSDRLYEETEDIVWLVKMFMAEYAAIKDMRRVREFSDFEHMTYELFRSNEDIRKVYRDKYDEILIDEYQDTNELQDSIFEIISDNNIFMVGDLKQSIYRFRGGDPYIFKKKSELYGSGGKHKRIILAQNFRSRQEVLHSVNDVFTRVMSNDAGDVDYTGDELIMREAKRDYYPATESDCRAELIYIVSDAPAEERREQEILCTVNKIKELLDSGATVYDTDTGRLRPIQKKDIVILENSTKHNGARLVSELARLGIDAYCDTKIFFDRREIKIMMSLISLISNLRQDIPLIAVMRSPIGGFTDNDLARIRLFAGETDCFITALRSFANRRHAKLSRRSFRKIRLRSVPKKGKRARLEAHCRKFLTELDRWRGYARRKSVAQLIWSIYEESYFYDIMGAIEYGEEAQFNLRLLYERAKQYESAGFRGLFSFIKYIELIEDNAKDIEGAKVVGENHDVVRIMTIHTSKGLEFPYVFLLNTGTSFQNRSDVTAIRHHKELMLGVRDIFYEEHYTRNTLLYDLIAETEKREARAESMRLAYVALTRAREKLFVTAAAITKPDMGADDIIAKHVSDLVDGKLLPSKSISVSGMYGWICPAAFTCPDTWKYEFYIPQDAEPEPENKESCEYLHSDELRKAVFDILDYRYPYAHSNTIPSRTSVTQLKELTIERESLDAPVYEPDNRRSSGTDDIAELMFSPLHQKPAFMREKGDKPANEIGTLYHNVMAEICLERVRGEGTGCIGAEIERLAAEEKIAAEDLRYLDTKKIAGFFESRLGQRMLASDETHREAPFQINISAALYDPELPSEYENEPVILQGIIDCFFKEDGSYVLLDYKTDRIANNEAALLLKYKKQLELYKKAIEQLTGETVMESYLYLFDTEKVLRI